MNIEPLYKLKERLNTSAVAGISLMPEDFRLKQAIEQIEPLSKAAPIFGKIYQGALHILEVPEDQRANALLDELALLDALLVTQAAVGIDGECTAVNEGMHQGVITNAPFSKAAPILEALTTRGSGHYNLVFEVHQESPESFQDFRLRAALVKGLGAGYSVLAEQIEQWLKEEDESILPLLKQGFLPDGKSDMVRRVHVIETIAKAKENDWYIAMLETAQGVVREPLIYALRHEKKNEELLFNLVKTEKGREKKAAIFALSYMESEKIYEYFGEQLGHKSKQSEEFAAVQKRAKPLWENGYFYLSKSDPISDLVAESIRRCLDFLEKRAEKGDDLVELETRRRISQMLTATIGKTSDAMIAVYKRFAAADVFDKLKNAERKKEKISFSYLDTAFSVIRARTVGTPYSLSYLDYLLAKSILFTKSPKLFQLAQELYQEYQEAFLTSALVAALLSKEGEEVFSEFSFYLVQEGKKESAKKKEGRMAIMEAFSFLRYDQELDGYVLVDKFQEPYMEKWFTVKEKIYGEFDLRWITLLTDNKIKKDGEFSLREWGSSSLDSEGMASWDSILERMICPNNTENCRLLGTYFYNRALYGPKGRFGDYFEAVRKCHVNFEPEDLIQHMKQSGKKSTWSFMQMLERIPMIKEKKKEVLTEMADLVVKKEISFSNGSEEAALRVLKAKLEEMESES